MDESAASQQSASAAIAEGSRSQGFEGPRVRDSSRGPRAKSLSSPGDELDLEGERPSLPSHPARSAWSPRYRRLGPARRSGRRRAVRPRDAHTLRRMLRRTLARPRPLLSRPNSRRAQARSSNRGRRRRRAAEEVRCATGLRRESFGPSEPRHVRVVGRKARRVYCTDVTSARSCRPRPRLWRAPERGDQGTAWLPLLARAEDVRRCASAAPGGCGEEPRPQPKLYRVAPIPAFQAGGVGVCP
jgi:hypothetical protein